MNEHHPMRYIGLRSYYHEFLCPICGRHLLIHTSPQEAGAGDKTFVILKQGDPQASHSGGIGAWVVDSVEVQEVDEACELSDEWREWLDKIFGDED